MTSLAIKETILGVLKARDLCGTGKIHSSDFRTAVADLGFPMGSQVVADVLVHCHLDPRDGNIDFSQLERELIRERRVQSAKPPSVKPIPTSTGSAASPWRSDILHKEKLLAEEQSRLVREHRTDVHAIYKRFVNNETSVDDTVSFISELGIQPTRLFLALLKANEASSEITFADFTRTLVAYDPANSGSDDRPAGATHPSLRKSMVNLSEVDIGLFNVRKRKDPIIIQSQQQRAFQPQRNTRKLALEIDGNGTLQSKFRSSKAVHDTVFVDGPTQPLVSHSQADLQAGVIGEDVDLAYNSEQKLLREQVLAALRKLDNCELSFPEFQNMVFDMGFELPAAVVKEVQRSTHCGQLDWRKCVEILDAEVFKVKAFNERPQEEELESARMALINSLKRSGSTSLSQMAATFRRLDLDANGSLSLNEFKRVFQEVGVDGVTDAQLRMLFNWFDKSGDGAIQLEEFLEGVRGSPRPIRRKIILQAFQRLNRTGSPTVSLDYLASVYNPQANPDFINGTKSERELVKEFMVALDNEEHDGQVGFDQFESYFLNLSACEDDDTAFAKMMKQAWHLDETGKKPPPPLVGHMRGSKTLTSDRTSLPRAKQVHGDCVTWDQEVSELEETTAYSNQTRRILHHDNKNSTAVIFPSSADVSESIVHGELKLFGGVAINVNKSINQSSKTLLAWEQRKPSASSTVNSSPHSQLYAAESTKEDNRGFVWNSYAWSPHKLKQYAGEKPYGVDPSESPKDQRTATGPPKSLADVMREKSKQ